MKPTLSFSDIESYIRDQMQMAHIYQPVMLRVLLERRGKAEIRDIAQALLRYDLSQVEYYETRIKNMVGKVLTRNGIVEPLRQGRRITGYRLKSDSLTDHEIAKLKRFCDERLEDYIEKWGDRIWGHRGTAEGYISGPVRYEVLKRAKYRCELCGAHEGQAALHVDHIVPRNKGGSDDISNFQALCINCNSSKRDRDDTDFRDILDSYGERADDCIFCGGEANRVIAENELCYAIRDGFPVSALHTLVIPKRHVADYFDLYQPELNAIHAMLGEQRGEILKLDQSVTGFNMGINAGADAGQTIFHAHAHLIPRREGDVAEPRGGVRGVIPEKRIY